MVIAFQGLEDGTVLTVDRGQAHAIFFNRVHDKASGCNKGFLIGKGDVLMGCNGGKDWLQACITDHGSKNCVRLSNRRTGKDAFFTGKDFRRSVIAGPQPCGSLFIAEGGHVRPKFPDLRFQKRIVGMGSKGCNTEPFRACRHNLKGLGSNGPGRP